MYNPTKPNVDIILKLIQSTWETPYVAVKSSTYAIFKKKFDYPEVDHTDGIGTKGIYHWKKQTFENAVIDALAMNLNDLLLVRARAYKLQNHLVLPKDDSRIITIIMRKMVSECKKRKIAITGGETSIHGSAGSFDISMTVSGFIKKTRPNKFKTGDVVIGIKSNGLHSNGFTMVRKLYGEKFDKEFVKPTKIYYDDLFPILEKVEVNGMMHMTGGAFTKLRGLMTSKQVLEIDAPRVLGPQRIFHNIYKKGLSDRQMYTTFNCGVGFVLSIREKDASRVLDLIKGSAVIGRVVKGDGKIMITSSFSKKVLKL